MIDLEGQRLAAEDLVRVGEFVSANGQDSESQPLTNIVSYVDIEFSVDNTSNFLVRSKVSQWILQHTLITLELFLENWV